MAKKKISFIITALGIGGAEMMLLRLIRSLDRSTYDPQVITLKSNGALEQEFQKLDIPLSSAGMDTFFGSLKGIFIVKDILREFQPDVVFCWMYHANLIGGLAAKLYGARKIFWNIRNSGLKQEWKTPLTALVVRLGVLVSRFVPDIIVVNSQAARFSHIRMGYDADKMQIIHNGIDTQEFMPDRLARNQIRKELTGSDSELIVGMAARFHPQKDHLSFIRAASLILEKIPNIQFVLSGRGMDNSNERLKVWIRTYSLEKNVKLLGVRRDMPKLMCAWDLAVLSSAYGESFPNVVAEAMSCEVPCLVTDVGDSALIVSETCLVVPPCDYSALAMAAVKLLADKDLRVELGKKVRLRIIDNFSIERITREYESLFNQ